MIDLSTKQPVVAGDRVLRKSQPLRSGKRKTEEKPHNLPQNIPGSESDEYESGCSSEDQNDMVDDNDFSTDYAKHNSSSNELNCAFENLTVSDRRSSRKLKTPELAQHVDVVVKKLSALVKSYQDSKKATALQESIDNDLKARSPFKKATLRPAPYDVSPSQRRLTVNTSHGNGAHVLIQHSPPDVFTESEINLSDPCLSLLMDALNDKRFMESWLLLPAEEASNILEEFSKEEYVSAESLSSERPSSSPEPTATLSPDPNFSTSPASNVDSGYGTWSPGSEVVTSPGSPALPHRSSLSSESDQELDEVATQYPAPDSAFTPSTSTSHSVNGRLGKQRLNQEKSGENRLDKTLKPLGDPSVSCVTASASQRLYELSTSTSFCVKHFTIQLVRVVMSTKTEIASDKIQGFCKSLLSTMKTKLGTKPHEGDIWQLAIYAHIQFLTARVQEYKAALLSRDEGGLSLLYIAVFERPEKPLIARYIAESMAQVGYDPQALDADEQGNTILHLVARQGDSHVNVLSELLMATGENGQPLFSLQKTNHAGQTPLHSAAQSRQPHLNTLLVLLKQGADPFLQDRNGKTPLHFHVLQASQWQPRREDDFMVVSKMLFAPLSLARHVKMLKQFCADPNTPSDFSSYILHIVHTNVKDQKPKKN